MPCAYLGNIFMSFWANSFRASLIFNAMEQCLVASFRGRCKNFYSEWRDSGIRKTNSVISFRVDVVEQFNA